MLDPALDDMFAPEAIADPHRYYARLREQDPVHWNDRYQLWVVTRYDDVVWMIRHHELFSSAVIRTDPRPPYPPVDAEGLGLVDYVRGFRADQLVEHDRPEPRHAPDRVRVLHASGHGSLAPLLRRAVGELLDAVQDRGRMDQGNSSRARWGGRAHVTAGPNPR